MTFAPNDQPEVSLSSRPKARRPFVRTIARAKARCAGIPSLARSVGATVPHATRDYNDHLATFVVVLVAVMTVTSVFVGAVTPVGASSSTTSQHELGSPATVALDPASKAVALEPSLEWFRTYGGDRADSVIQASDGTYVTVQSLDSGGDIRILRVDGMGDLVSGWPKQYSVADNSDGTALIIGTSDGGFAVAGTTPFYVLKTDDTGTVEWQYTGPDRRFVYDFIQTSDGGYLAVGDVVANQEMYVTKLDASGNEVWTRTFPDLNLPSARGVVEAEGAYAITGKVNLQTARNPFFIRLDPATGDRIAFPDGSLTKVYTEYTGGSFDKVVYDGSRYVTVGFVPFFSSDGLVVALETDGTATELGRYAGGTTFADIEQTADGFILVGYRYANDAWVVKTDPDGNVQWEQLLVESNGVFEIGANVVQASDGGYVVAGFTATSSLATLDTFLFRLSPEPIDAVDVTVDTPASTAYVTTTTVDLAGTATSTESTVTSVEVSDDGGATFDAATFDGLNWDYTYAAAGDGTYTLDVKATDALGAFDSEEVVVTVDTTPPEVGPVTLDPSLVVGGEPVTVSVPASDANGIDRVFARVGGTSPSLIFLTRDASGDWTGTFESSTSDETVTVEATAIDAAGNRASASETYTVDATPPQLTFDAPSESDTEVVEVSGAVTDINGIQSITLDVNGGAQNGGQTIPIDPNSLGVDGGFQESLTLSDGENTLVLSAIDLVGNENTVSTTVTVTLGTSVVVDDSGDDVGVTVSNPTPGESISVSLPGGSDDARLSKLDIVPETAEGFRLNIVDESEPSAAPPLVIGDDTGPLTYLTVTHTTTEGEIGSVEFTFVVSDESVPVDPEDIRLYRFPGERWTELPTELVGPVDGGYEYTATSPGFSTFAIGPSPPEFTVLGASVDPTETVAGSPVTVSGTVENTGGATGTVTLTLTADGEEVATTDVTVGGGETASYEFEYTFGTAGTYDLAVEGVDAGTLLVKLPVEIDVQPGDETNSIPAGKRAIVPVVVLGTDTFDPTGELVVTSLRFGSAGAVADDTGATPFNSDVEDVNGDGIDDLVVLFRADDAGFDADDTVAVLEGLTTDGLTVFGSDVVDVATRGGTQR